MRKFDKKLKNIAKEHKYIATAYGPGGYGEQEGFSNKKDRDHWANISLKEFGGGYVIYYVVDSDLGKTLDTSDGEEVLECKCDTCGREYD